MALDLGNARRPSWRPWPWPSRAGSGRWSIDRSAFGGERFAGLYSGITLGESQVLLADRWASGDSNVLRWAKKAAAAVLCFALGLVGLAPIVAAALLLRDGARR